MLKMGESNVCSRTVAISSPYGNRRSIDSGAGPIVGQLRGFGWPADILAPKQILTSGGFLKRWLRFSQRKSRLRSHHTSVASPRRPREAFIRH